YCLVQVPSGTDRLLSLSVFRPYVSVTVFPYTTLFRSSGFQSAQYRMIEIMCTEIQNLVHIEEREDYKDINLTSIDSLFNLLYWQFGATELATGEKTLSLKNFEDKYGQELKALIAAYRKINLWKKYQSCSER